MFITVYFLPALVNHHTLYGFLNCFISQLISNFRSFLCVVFFFKIIVGAFVRFILTIVLPLFLQFTDSDFPFWYLQTVLTDILKIIP
jgi:hypothetical protein